MATAVTFAAPLIGYAYIGRLERGFVAVAIGLLVVWCVSNVPFGLTETRPYALFAFAATTIAAGALAADAALLVRRGRSRMGVPEQSTLVYVGLLIASISAVTIYDAYSRSLLFIARQVCDSAMRVEPTIWPGECVLATPKRRWTRGDIVLLRQERQLEYSRILGLPGDRVALNDGVPSVNGTPFLQTPADVPLQASSFRPKARDPRREVNADGRAYDVINLVSPDAQHRTELEMVVPERRLVVLSDTRGWIDGKRLLREVELADAVGTPVMILRSSQEGRLGTLVR